jgi:DNA mismatch repair protein MutS2
MNMAKIKQNNIPVLDLHGFKVDEVFDAVEKFLRQTEAKGAGRAKILHGKGTGKVKSEVLRYLQAANYPSKPEKLESGAVNDGALIVFLD